MKLKKVKFISMLVLGLILIPNLTFALAPLKTIYIYMNLKDLLPNNLIDAVISRVRQIQNAIRYTMKANKGFLLNAKQWNKHTMAKELSINSETYFKNFSKELRQEM